MPQPVTSVTGFAMTGIFAWGAVGRADVGIGPYGELQGVRYKAGRRAEGSPPCKFDFVRRDGRGRTPSLRRGHGVRGRRDDVGIGPYGGGKRCGESETMWASSLRRGYKECGTRPGGRTGASARCIVFFRLGATHIKKALCYDAGIIAKGFFILDCAYLTSSMMAVSAASPRRTPVRTMRV